MTSAATASLCDAGVVISFEAFSATSTDSLDDALVLWHRSGADNGAIFRAARPLRATARRDMVVERQGATRPSFLIGH